MPTPRVFSEEDFADTPPGAPRVFSEEDFADESQAPGSALMSGHSAGTYLMQSGHGSPAPPTPPIPSTLAPGVGLNPNPFGGQAMRAGEVSARAAIDLEALGDALTDRDTYRAMGMTGAALPVQVIRGGVNLAGGAGHLMKGAAGTLLEASGVQDPSEWQPDGPLDYLGGRALLKNAYDMGGQFAEETRRAEEFWREKAPELYNPAGQEKMTWQQKLANPGWYAEVIGQAVPSLAVAAVGGWPVLMASETGSMIQDLDESPGGSGMSEGEKLLWGTAYGAVSGIMEKVGGEGAVGTLRGSVKAIAKTKGFKAALKETWDQLKKGALDKGEDAAVREVDGALRWLGKRGVAGATEAGTEVAQNAAQNLVAGVSGADPGRPLMQGSLEAAVGGFGPGAGLSALTAPAPRLRGPAQAPLPPPPSPLPLAPPPAGVPAPPAVPVPTSTLQAPPLPVGGTKPAEEILAKVKAAGANPDLVRAWWERMAPGEEMTEEDARAVWQAVSRRPELFGAKPGRLLDDIEFGEPGEEFVPGPGEEPPPTPAPPPPGVAPPSTPPAQPEGPTGPAPGEGVNRIGERRGPVRIHPEELQGKSIEEQARIVGGWSQALTEAVEARNRAEEKAATDRLTGLISKDAFKDTVRDEHTHHMGLDLRGFKDINDTYGEVDGGDAALTAVGEAIRSAVETTGEGRVEAGRTGGDEFSLRATGDDADLLNRVKADLDARIAQIRITTPDGRTFTLAKGIRGTYIQGKGRAGYERALNDLGDLKRREGGSQRDSLRAGRDAEAGGGLLDQRGLGPAGVAPEVGQPEPATPAAEPAAPALSGRGAGTDAGRGPGKRPQDAGGRNLVEAPRGSATRVKFEDGPKSAHYELHEASSLNVDLPDYQNRNASPPERWIGKRGEGGGDAKPFDPAEFLVDHPRPQVGAPVVNPADGGVIAGNTRIKMVRDVLAKKNPKKLREWKAALKAKAASFGLDPKAVDGMKAPVLVRVLDEAPRATGSMVEEANRSLTTALSAAEQAASDAEKLPDGALDSMQYGEDETFASALKRAGNAPVFSRVIRHLFPGSELPAFLDPRTKELSQAGMQRIENAVTAKSLGLPKGSPALNALLVSTEAGINGIRSAFQKVGGALLKGRSYLSARSVEGDPFASIGKAVEKFVALREAGKDVGDFLSGAQGSLFGEEARTEGMSPDDLAALGHLNDLAKSPKKLREFLSGVGQAVEAAPRKGQRNLLGEQDTVSAKEIFDAARKGTEGGGGPTLYSSIIPGLTNGRVEALVNRGVDLFLSGARTFAEWSKAMRAYYGAKIRPHLQKLWASVRKALRDERGFARFLGGPFEQQLSQLRKGRLDPRLFLDYGKTPDVLKMLGIEDLPLGLRGSKVFEIAKEHPEITDAVLSTVRDAIHRPVMVFDSKEYGEDAAVVLTEVWAGGKPVVVALHLEKQAGHLVIHKVASVYGKDGVSKVAGWLDGGLLRYADKEKSQRWLSVAGLRRPGVQARPWLTPNIKTDDDLVKWRNARRTGEKGFVDWPGSRRPGDTPQDWERAQRDRTVAAPGVPVGPPEPSAEHLQALWDETMKHRPKPGERLPVGAPLPEIVPREVRDSGRTAEYLAEETGKRGLVTRNILYRLLYGGARVGRSAWDTLGRTEAGANFLRKIEAAWWDYHIVSADRRFPVEEALQGLSRPNLRWVRENFLEQFEKQRVPPDVAEEDRPRLEREAGQARRLLRRDPQIRALTEAWEHVNTLIGNDAKRHKIQVRLSDGGTRPFVARDPGSYVPHRLTAEAKEQIDNARGPIFDALWGPNRGRVEAEYTRALLEQIPDGAKGEELKRILEGLQRDEGEGVLKRSGLLAWLAQRGWQASSQEIADKVLDHLGAVGNPRHHPLWALANLGTVTKRHGSLEFERTMELPFTVKGADGKTHRVLESDPVGLLRHIDSAVRRIAVAKHFGPRTATRNIEEMVAHMISQGTSSKVAEVEVPLLWNRMQGADQGYDLMFRNEKVKKAYGALDALTAASNLSMAWISNTFGGHMPEAVRTGLYRTAKSFLWSFTHRLSSPEARRLRRRGAILENVALAYAATEQIDERFRKATGYALKGTGFNWANAHINLALAYHWSTLLEETVAGIRGNRPPSRWREALGVGWSTGRARRYLTEQMRFSPHDVDRMVRDGVTEKDVRRSIFKAQELANAMNESPVERPPLINNPLFNIVFRYSSYIRKYADTVNYSVREAERGHYAPLARLLVAGAVTGEVIIAVQNFFMDRERDEDDLLERLLNDLLAAGTFGFWGMFDYWWQRRNRYGTSFFQSVMEPPVLGTLTELVNGVSESAGEKNLAPLWRSFVRIAPAARMMERQAAAAAERMGTAYGRRALVRRLDRVIYHSDGKNRRGEYHSAFDPRPDTRNTAAKLLKRYHAMGLTSEDLRRDLEELKREREAGRRPQ